MGHRLATFLIALCLAAFRPAFADETMTANEHFVEAGGVRLRIWEKSLGAPDGKPIVVLAHGSATAGQESFDLQVPGKPSFSFMDFLAGEGFDVFAPDIRGFGRSTHPRRWSDDGRGSSRSACRHRLHTDRARRAQKSILLPGHGAPNTRGSTSSRTPQQSPATSLTPKCTKTAPTSSNGASAWRNSAKAHTWKFRKPAWTKRFASMTPESANDPDVIDAFAKAAASVEHKSPTGPHIDMTTLLPMVDGTKITVPTLVIHGQYDDVADAAGLAPFYGALPNPEKSYVIIPDAGHMAHLQKGHSRLQREIAAFLKR